ncbi:DUF1353 domain-containing protein [Pseudomonas sp. PDM26]|uniref:DUF1353 domain-containing protein n=1 Tax=Pseudomonas sp. PDM26 TaxID=2854766 RepID=UPI001C45EFC5|nr:DUF1353 domain-containing protein [Pseudomonas sp. PDM26]MBV7548334.1 DUF1353 domain-containing protein [Pseudomonas sp. PDM26]
MYKNIVLLMFFLSVCAQVSAGGFSGELRLVPKGCQNTNSRVCRLDSMLTFKSTDGLVWQTDVWTDGNGQSGTTDGASIPKWAQSVIGDAYDESFLKAAIIHDHYCYEENHVRTWRQTHRMFYDALNELGIVGVKAKTMYFAVYAFGPHWVKLVPGEKCGENCIKSIDISGEKMDTDQFDWPVAQEEIAKFKQMAEKDQDLSLAEIESYAKLIKPDDFYQNHGDTYVPTGSDDPNFFSRY